MTFLDRMAPDGTWYDSATTAETEEPIGMIVEVKPHVGHGNVLGVVGHWKAWFRGEWVAPEYSMLTLYPTSKLDQGGGGVALFSRMEWARSRLSEVFAKEKIENLRFKVSICLKCQGGKCECKLGE